MRLNNKEIGTDETFIIAEVGLSHNGNIWRAKELINEAKQCGADAVKFQAVNGIQHLKQYSLSKGEFQILKSHCDSNGILFLCTPHTFDSVDWIDELVPVHKIASSYIHNLNFLKTVAAKGKPILISTGNLLRPNGMASINEIKAVSYHLRKNDTVLLHCVSKYPCLQPNYKRIKKISSIVKNIVGLSDHSKHVKVPQAPIIEKHLMLSDKDSIDRNVSLTPHEFDRMVEYIRRNK